MARVHIQLTDDQLVALQRSAEAAQEGVSAQVRRVIDEWIAKEQRNELWERAMAAVGGFESGLGRQMVSVFVDTSALIALLDADDARHVEARAVLDWLRGNAELVTTNYIEIESVALARRRLGPEAAVPPRVRGRIHDAPGSHAVDNGGADLVSVSELAARAGRPVNTIQSWRRRHADFPAPVAQLAVGPIWSWPTVEAWIARRSGGRHSSRAIRPPTPIDVDRARYAALPGWDLVDAGLTDIRAGRDTAEAALLRSATSRLADIGIKVPPTQRASGSLYGLIEAQVGEGAAHGRYNAMRRRLDSFLRSARVDEATH